MKTLFISAALILAMAHCSNAISGNIVIGGLDGEDPSDTTEHVQIIMALSGGGARGLASIGVIKAFEEKNIEIAAIAGTSMGGIIGGLYASGYSPDELSSIVSEIDFNEFFVDAPKRQTMFLTRRQDFERHLISLRFDRFKPVIPQGWTGGQKITAVLNRLTTKANYRCGGDFSKLEIPFKTVATDVVSGNEVILDSGSISEAMRATMAFPLALTAVERNGYVLMDGGMVTPIPVTITRSMADSGVFLVAISTASKLDPKEKLKTPVDIAGQVTTIMTADKLAAELKMADFVIEPNLLDFESADFDFKDRIIAIGYRAGIEASDSILAVIARRKNTTNFNTSDILFENVPDILAESLKTELLNKSFTKEKLVARLKDLTLRHSLFRLKAVFEEADASKSGTANATLRISAQKNPNVAEFKFVIQGNTIYEDEVLAALLVGQNEALSSIEFKMGLSRIEDKYHRDGYDVAYVRTTDIDFENKTITIIIDEAIVRGIDVEENSRTRDWLVRSYFPLKVGQPYTTKRAASGLDNLYGTDLFEKVLVELAPVTSGAIVKIRVKERYYTQLRLGWHWDDDYKSEQFLELLDDNIRGMGLEYLLHAQYADGRQKYLAQLKMDRIWFSYITARISAYHNLLDRSIYDGEGKEFDTRQERKTGFEISLGQQVKRFGTVRGALIFEEARTRSDVTRFEDKFNQRIVQLESVIETFDKLPFPNTGKKLQAEIRFAGEFMGGVVEYTRFYSSLEGYFPFGKYVNFHPKASLGLSGSILPPTEQFYIGGAKSFSGYRQFEYAGDKVILFNNELRFKLPLNLYLIGRYDIGEVYVQTDQIKLRNLRHGWGSFLAFNSPIGSFELGYGVADSDNDRFYVNIGLIF